MYHMVKVFIRNVHSFYEFSASLIPTHLSGISLNDFFSEKLCLTFCIRSCLSVICFLSTLQFSFVALTVTPIKY